LFLDSYVLLYIITFLGLCRNLDHSIRTKCDKTSRKYTIVMALRITALVLLMLGNIIGAAQPTNIWFHK